MRFIVTEKDLQNNPVLLHRGFEVGDICETTDFVTPTLRLEPPAQDRDNTPEVKFVNIPQTVEETVEEEQPVVEAKAENTTPAPAKTKAKKGSQKKK